MKKLLLVTSSLFMVGTLWAVQGTRVDGAFEVAGASVISPDAEKLQALFDVGVFNGIMRSPENKKQVKAVLDNLMRQLAHLDNQIHQQAKKAHESEKNAEYENKSYVQRAKDKASQIWVGAEDETPHINKKVDEIKGADDHQQKKLRIIRKFYEDYMRDLVATIQNVPNDSLQSLTAFRDAYAVNASVLNGLEQIIKAHLKNETLRAPLTEEVITQYNLIVDHFIHLRDHAAREELVQEIAQSMIESKGSSGPGDQSDEEDKFWASIREQLDAPFPESAMLRQSSFDGQTDQLSFDEEADYMKHIEALRAGRQGLQRSHDFMNADEEPMNADEGQETLSEEEESSDFSLRTPSLGSDEEGQIVDFDSSSPEDEPLPATRPSYGKSPHIQRLVSDEGSGDDVALTGFPSRAQLTRQQPINEPIPAEEDMLGLVEAMNGVKGALSQLRLAMTDAGVAADDRAIHRMYKALASWTDTVSLDRELDHMEKFSPQPQLNVAFRNAHQAVANYRDIVESFEDQYPTSILVTSDDGATLMDQKSGLSVPIQALSRSTSQNDSQISRQGSEVYGDED